MTRLVWGAAGQRFYETGVDRGVLYTDGSPGVAWSGLISVEENPSNGEIKSYYLDGLMYLQVPTYEVFGATITAFNRPPEFAKCDGVATGLNGLMIPHQRRGTFGLSYRTFIGNDIEGNDHSYQIHLIYSAITLPSQRNYRTIDGGVNPAPYSWQISAKPPLVPGYKRTPHLIIDSATAPTDLLSALEDILYGTEGESPRLPTPQEIFDLGFGIQVIDNGDGTFTVTGPDEYVSMIDTDEFQIISPNAIFTSADTYRISTL